MCKHYTYTKKKLKTSDYINFIHNKKKKILFMFVVDSYWRFHSTFFFPIHFLFTQKKRKIKNFHVKYSTIHILIAFKVFSTLLCSNIYIFFIFFYILFNKMNNRRILLLFFFFFFCLHSFPLLWRSRVSSYVTDI